jgi:hypothetical protein
MGIRDMTDARPRPMTAAAWNLAHPKGTYVRYWPVMGDDDYVETQTRSSAWETGSGAGVVLVNGKTGGVALSHLLVIPPAPIRCGDTVLHHPTGEELIVAWADPETGDLAWCGWPAGAARIGDCVVVKRASEREHCELVRRVAAMRDSRGSRVRRLYAQALEEAVS